MSDSPEIENPIINSPYEEPRYYWKIHEHADAEKIEARRAPIYRYTPPGKDEKKNGYSLELKLVSHIRERMKEWLPQALRGEGGVSAVTMELMNYWRREGREHPLFYAQLEAAETIIFLTEARSDYLQGLNIPLDEPEKKGYGFSTFTRVCCKMATGAGKTTVMGMLAAWSILNKQQNRTDGRYSDAVLVICPNITIRNRLAELDTRRYESSIYRTRDLVPPHWASTLAQGRVLVVNWHLFEPRVTAAARVQKNGTRKTVREVIHIGDKTQNARGKRYMTLNDLQQKADLDLLDIKTPFDSYNPPKKVEIESEKYIESDAAIVRRVLERVLGKKENILVFNDEAHHAYRLRGKAINSELLAEDEAIEYYQKEATVWVDGLDRVQKHRRINQCVDFSATPYYLASAGKDANRIFPWVVSDFSLNDAIESGLVKIPQFAARDVSGAPIPGYFNIWEWVMKQLTPAERGGGAGKVNPIAILKYSHVPLTILGSEWQKTYEVWQNSDDPRPPVFIIVCRDTKLAKLIYQWIADDQPPAGIAPANMPLLRNTDSQTNTIRVDVKVTEELESGNARSDEAKWLRHVLDTIGKTHWNTDSQKRPILPEGFAELAAKLGRDTSYPPGRDVRCIISVSMLTEGWDCNTVTHIAGLRPFMSQLLCEQVVGRGLRRASYSVDAETGFMPEEIAQVFGVPLQNMPLKTSGDGKQKKSERESYPIYAVPGREKYVIRFPRVDGYRQIVRSHITLDDSAAPTTIDSNEIPPEVEMRAGLRDGLEGPPVGGPGQETIVNLEEFRSRSRLQALQFLMAKEVVHKYASQSECSLSPQALFPQALEVVATYFDDKVEVLDSYSDKKDGFLSPYYEEIMERIMNAIRSDDDEAQAAELPCYETERPPGSSGDVNFRTFRKPYAVKKSHVNAVVPDTKTSEQSAAYRLDRNERVQAFVKNEGMGFAIPYFSNGKLHDYMPDFIARLETEEEHYLILETKGFPDEAKEDKKAAAVRWTKAVNAEGSFGTWHYQMIDSSNKTDEAIAECLKDIENQ